MGSHHFRRVAHRLITGIALLTIVVTTFWTGTQAPTRAAQASDARSEQEVSYTPASDPVSSAPQPASFKPAELAPMNAVVISDPDRLSTLEKTITRAGGYVYIRQGNTLYVGLNDLKPGDLTSAGARAVYQGLVPDRDLAALSAEDRAAASLWNQMASESASQAQLSVTGSDVASTMIWPTDLSRASSVQAALTLDQQTSDYLVGDVAVRVLFVESTGTGAENWTEVEINKVKTEIVQALDWWTTAATVPEVPGADPRPSANIQWMVSYVSPFEGTDTDRVKVQVNTEPITLSTAAAAADGGWMSQVAHNFTGLPADGTALRQLSDSARDTAGTDWGFTLFVVDSSSDADGLFSDEKAAGAALNGPYAFVTYDGGKVSGDVGLGTANLEILIAKMVGHVFGAGDETYVVDPANPDAGCRPGEVYGYFRIAHENCEYSNDDPEASLMRSGSNMVNAYHNNALSNAARQQVGWYDSDSDGFYDVVDTLTDTFIGLTSGPCPVLHIANQEIENLAAAPGDIGESEEWGVTTWDPVNGGYVEHSSMFIRVNVNWIGYVWGRVGSDPWVAAAPAGSLSGETRAWTKADLGYTLYLPGKSGGLNRVQIAIMNRWEQQTYITPSPVNVSVMSPLNQLAFYETNDGESVAFYGADGTPDAAWSQWAPLSGGYHGGATMISSTLKSEACFAFSGLEATLYYSKETDGAADVYVDGELHSTIRYTVTGQKQARHVITNLPSGTHTVQLEVVSGVVDFDAIQLTSGITDATKIINAAPAPTGEIPAIDAGFVESVNPKMNYVGVWGQVALLAPDRPGPTPDGLAHRSSNPYDRFYFIFQNADAVAIYRRVFPGGGSGEVVVDGELYGTMYNDAAVDRVMPFYIGGLSPTATHTVEVRINPNTPYFDLESVRFRQLATETLTPGLYEPVGPGQPLDVPFNGAQDPNNGTWTTRSTLLESKEQGALLTMFFKGSAVAVNVGTGSSGGLLEMYVDGRLMRTVDTKTSGSKDQPVIAHGFDATLTHVLQVRQINANLAKPKSIQVYGYTVYTFDPVPAGSYEEYEYDAAGQPTQSVFIYEQGWKSSKLVANDPKPSAGRYINSNHEQARAYLYFTGADSLTLYATAGSYGAADIYVNNEFQGTFILKRSGTIYNVPFTLTGFDAAATNVLEMRINLTSKLSKKINLDRVVLYNKPKLEPRLTAYQNDETVDVGGTTAPALQFSGQWTNVSDARASDGSFHLSSALADQVVFDVTGAMSVVITRRLYSKYGIVEVYVDDALYGTFDSYTSNPSTGAFQEHYVIAGLDPGFDHTIRLSAQRSGKKMDKFKPFDIDAVQVRAVDVSGTNFLEDGRYESNDPDVYLEGGGGAIDYLGASWVVGNPLNNDPTTGTIKGDKAIVLFQGNAFRIWANMSSNGSKALVYIDSKLVGTIDTKNSTAVNEVPFTFVDLAQDMHTVEIVIQGRVAISAFEVFTTAPYAAGSYDMAPTPSPYVLLSGLWTVNGEVLQTKQLGASLFLYVSNIDAVWVEHAVSTSTGDIEVYVNHVLHSTIDATYIKSRLPNTTGEYLVGGLSTATEDGGWIEIRNPKAKLIGITLLRADYISPQLTNTENTEEAETLNILRTSGLWEKKPAKANDVQYNGGFYLETKNAFAHFYIPVQYLSYVTIYRPLNSSYGDANVYIDGVFWGTMPNSSSSSKYKVPFSIGPIPDPSSVHTVELRAASKKKFALDTVVGYGVQSINPGFYENDSPVFIGGEYNETQYANAYFGTWKVITDTGASGGTLHQTTKRGDRLAAVFYGNELIIYRRLSSKGKTMLVYVDGVAHPINNNQKVTTQRAPYTILLPNDGPHSFELVADSGQLDFDAIEIKNVVPATDGAYQHDSVYVALNGTWTTVVDSPEDIHSEGSYISTNEKYASAFFMFTGKQVTTYMITGRYWGIMSAYLDGVLQSDVNLYLYDKVLHPVDEPFFKFDLSGLEDTTHVLELRFEGKKDKKGKAIVNLDAITVNGYPVPKPGEHQLPEEPEENPNVPMEGCFEDYYSIGSPWTWFHSGDLTWRQDNSDFASGHDPNDELTWTYHWTTGNPGDLAYAEFTFKASGFSLMYVKYPSGGIAKLYVDGEPLTQGGITNGELSMYDSWSDGRWRSEALYTATGFDPTVTHTLHIEWLDSPVGSRIYIDRIDLPEYNPACDPPTVP